MLQNKHNLYVLALLAVLTAKTCASNGGRETGSGGSSYTETETVPSNQAASESLSKKGTEALMANEPPKTPETEWGTEAKTEMQKPNPASTPPEAPDQGGRERDEDEKDEDEQEPVAVGQSKKKKKGGIFGRLKEKIWPSGKKEKGQGKEKGKDGKGK